MQRGITKALKKVLQTADDVVSKTKADKIGVYIKLDRSIVQWFKQSGSGYQERINEILKRFVSEVTFEQGRTKKSLSSLERAQELFEKYYEQCFWHMKRDLIITKKELPSIIKGLKTYGGHIGHMEASELCR